MHSDPADWWKGGKGDDDDDMYTNPDWWKGEQRAIRHVKIPLFAHFYAWMFVFALTLWPVPVCWCSRRRPR